MKITLEFEHPWELTNLLKELGKQMKEEQATQDESERLAELRRIISDEVYKYNA